MAYRPSIESLGTINRCPGHWTSFRRSVGGFKSFGFFDDVQALVIKFCKRDLVAEIVAGYPAVIVLDPVLRFPREIDWKGL